MPSVPEALASALDHHRAGRLRAAEQIYRQILQAEPNHADALHLLGVMAHQAGQHEAAVEYIGRAIQRNGNAAAFHSNLANVYQALHRIPEAVASCRRALELGPGVAEAHLNLGNALKAQGKLDAAMASYRRALELKPDLAAAHNDMGNALAIMERLEEATDSYRRALALSPDFALAHNNLGNALMKQRQREEAVGAYQRALALQPAYAEAHNNLGVAFRAQERFAEEAACYRRALSCNPDFAEAHTNLGLALFEQAKVEEAAACFRRVLELNPNDVEAHNNLGVPLKNQGKLDEAIACYRRALELNPLHTAAHSNLINTIHYHPAYDAAAIYAEQRRWNRQFAEPLRAFQQAHANDRDPERRLRLGYVSPDFRDHVVGRNVLPILERHERARFEIFCYAGATRPDALTPRFQAAADVWREIGDRPDPAAAELIRADGIDILIDLSLHTAGHRLPLFARKPAPVQVAWAGYPGATGLDAIDYRITDPYLDPPDAPDPPAGEKPMRLPHSFWCYHPLQESPPANPLPALASGRVTFGSLNNYCKINTGVIELWSKLLCAVKGSRLLLLSPEGAHREEALRNFARGGVSADRIEWLTPVPRPSYLATYHRIDLSLDPFPYHGHTTSLDSAWMGVPVVTLVGQTIVGRAGLSQAMNLDLPDLIAATPEEYVRIAETLAQDLPRLSQLRSTLRTRMQASPIMDAEEFTRDLEGAYRGMWRRWATKLPMTNLEKAASPSM